MKIFSVRSRSRPFLPGNGAAFLSLFAWIQTTLRNLGRPELEVAQKKSRLRNTAFPYLDFQICWGRGGGGAQSTFDLPMP